MCINDNLDKITIGTLPIKEAFMVKPKNVNGKTILTLSGPYSINSIKFVWSEKDDIRFVEINIDSSEIKLYPSSYKITTPIKLFDNYKEAEQYYCLKQNS